MKKRKAMLYLILISSIISIFNSHIIGIKLKPTIVEIGEFEAYKIESTIVNNALNEILKTNYNLEDLFNIITSNDNQIQTIDFNSKKVNELLNTLTIKVQEGLKQLENGMLEDLGINQRNILIEKETNLKKGILVEIPIGAVTKNVLFSDLGARIPIKLHFLGDVNSNIKTNIKEYGINNALMEIYVNVEIEAKIMLPFITKKICINNSFPIVIKVIQGNVPKYYGGELIKDSSLYSLPIE